MPVVTHLGTNIGPVAGHPNQIQIVVDNGGGGGGDPALITLTVVWDPAVMSFGNVIGPMQRFSSTNSSCTWTDYGIPWMGHRVFAIAMFRHTGNTDDTYVIANPTDARSGDSDSKEWYVPTTFPQET